MSYSRAEQNASYIWRSKAHAFNWLYLHERQILCPYGLIFIISYVVRFKTVYIYIYIYIYIHIYVYIYICIYIYLYIIYVYIHTYIYIYIFVTNISKTKKPISTHIPNSSLHKWLTKNCPSNQWTMFYVFGVSFVLCFVIILPVKDFTDCANCFLSNIRNIFAYSHVLFKVRIWPYFFSRLVIIQTCF